MPLFAIIIIPITTWTTTWSFHKIGRMKRMLARGAGETGAVEHVVSSWNLLMLSFTYIG